MEKIDDKSKKRYINILRRNFLFDQADDFPKEKLLNDERAEWLSFEKGETIYGYDDYKDSLGIILKGRVSVKKDRTRGILFNTLKAGDAFGGAVLFGKGPFIADIVSQSRSDIVFISSDLMRELMAFSDKINMNYIEYLTASLAFLNERLDIFSAGGAEERTLRYLNIKCRQTEDGCYMADGMSMTDLAEYLLVGRATLYRILSEFEQKGIIRKDGRKIYLIKGEII